MIQFQRPTLNIARRVLLGGFAFAILNGCSNLQPVAEFGKNASVIAGYSDVADDYPASLERQKVYGQTGPSVSDQAIAERKHDAQRLKDAQQILAAYARALGALASDDLINYNREIDALNTSLVNAKYVAAADTKGYADIVKLGLRLTTDIYRRHKLRVLITTYNRHIQKATGNLITIVDKGYISVGLGGETTALGDYVFGPAAKTTKDMEGMPETINIIAAQQTDILNKKKQNAKALVQGMRTFAKGHQELADNIGKVDFKVTLAVARDYANQLREIVKSFRT